MDEDKELTPESIANELSGASNAPKIEETGVRAETLVPFDITKLTQDQVQALKAMLAATPDSQRRKKENPRVTLRNIGGKIVVDFKNAFLALIEDVENNRQLYRHKIPVKFRGEDKFENVLYSEFINSERVVCEVVSSKQEVEEIVEGEVVSRQTGQLVEMVVKKVRSFFTIKLPDGDTLEIEGRIANG